MMINDMKNELTEQEMASITGGFDDNNPNDVIRSEEDFHMWMSLSWEEKEQVYALPDATSRRVKMHELAQRKANPNEVYAHGGGVSGGW